MAMAVFVVIAMNEPLLGYAMLVLLHLIQIYSYLHLALTHSSSNPVYRYRLYYAVIDAAVADDDDST